MLLAAGAIHAAGQVAARGQRRRTQSDWMKIEQERGISVSSSVMTFEHKDLIFNLLDTPGHEDFSEDTYRTLTAADCAVMVLDAAKGIEPQTLKLFEVCRLRDIPIITFINKLDREAQEIFDLLSEVEDKLALDVIPMQWPCASGRRFRGITDLRTNMFIPFAADGEHAAAMPYEGDEMRAFIDDDALYEECVEETDLAREYGEFKLESFPRRSYDPSLFWLCLA